MQAGKAPRVWKELLGLWLGTLLLIRLVVTLVETLGLHEIFLVLVPVLFLYAPVWLCMARGVDSWSYPLALPAFSDRLRWGNAVRLNILCIAVTVVPFVVGYHVWHTAVFGHSLQWIWPSDPLKLIGYHLFFVALPEEIFYRGYIQTRLDERYGTPWRVFGTPVGWGLILASLLFAFGHSLVLLQWWHPFIFFPSLVFGWMRNRTGGPLAGALFHAWANVTVATLDTLYGVIPP